MRGIFLFSFVAFLCSMVSANAQIYEVTVKTYADKTNFPAATFTLEAGGMQMKGFEGAIRAVGFGGEGIKPTKYAETEMRERLNLEMEEELAVKDWDKLDNELLRLERALERAEKQLSRAGRTLESVAEEKTSKRGRGTTAARGPRKKNQSTNPADYASVGASASADSYKYQAAYEAAKIKYDEFKTAYNKAKRTRKVLEEMVCEIDEKIRDKYQKLMDAPIIPDGTYPYGTFCAIELKEINQNIATIDFEYAISRFLGWMEGEGNNNGNMMNHSLDLEYIEMPKKKNVKVELGKQYCFQIARPEKGFGSLEDAKSKTSIFSDSGKAEASMDEAEVLAREQANPLNAHDDFVAIRKKFKGKDKRVVRAVVTISKKTALEE